MPRRHRQGFNRKSKGGLDGFEAMAFAALIGLTGAGYLSTKEPRDAQPDQATLDQHDAFFCDRAATLVTTFNEKGVAYEAGARIQTAEDLNIVLNDVILRDANGKPITCPPDGPAVTLGE